MISHKCIPIDSPSLWREALKGIEHAFAHTWESCYAFYLTTGFKTYLYCFEAENVRIICPLSEREFDGYTDIVTPYGFSGFVGDGDFPEFPFYWKEFVEKKGYVCGYISLNSSFENRTYFEANDVHPSNSLYCLDLTLSREDLFSNLDSNRKRQLRAWERISAGMILDKPALTEFFLANYHDFIRGLKSSPVYQFTGETLAFLCDLENVFMVGAGEPGKIEAVSLFACTPFAGEYMFNVSLPEGRSHAVKLLWSGVNYMRSIGIPVLNLGGGVREGDSLAQFKARFGARKTPFKCLKQVYAPAIYRTLCRRASADPHDLSGYFPPYRNPRRAINDHARQIA
jgi:hypothetical protein